MLVRGILHYGHGTPETRTATSIVGGQRVQSRFSGIQPMRGFVGAVSEDATSRRGDVLQGMENVQNPLGTSQVVELFFPVPLRTVGQNRHVGCVENS